MGRPTDSIGRDDAVLAARLWGLASSRYHSATVVPLDAPEPASLYAGFLRGGVDPVAQLQALACELNELAEIWEEWAERPSRGTGTMRVVDVPDARLPTICPRRAP